MKAGTNRHHKKLLDWATENASFSDAAKSPQRKDGGERSETIIPLDCIVQSRIKKFEYSHQNLTLY